MLNSLLLAGFAWAAGVAGPQFPVTLSSALPQPAAAVRALRPVPAQAAFTLPTSNNAAEEAFVALINTERSQRGLSTLTLDPMLTATARAHSQEMCGQNYFDHQSPTPGMTSPMDRYLASAKAAWAASAGVSAGRRKHLLLQRLQRHLQRGLCSPGVYGKPRPPGQHFGAALFKSRHRHLPQCQRRVLGYRDVQPRPHSLASILSVNNRK